MKGGNQRRLTDFANLLGRGLRQRQPVVPVSDCVLQSLELRDELCGLGGFRRELRRITSPLHRDSILMQHIFSHGTSRAHNFRQHFSRHRHGISTAPVFEILGAAFQPLTNLSNRLFLQHLAESFLMLRAKFNQAVDELCFPAWLLKNFQAAQRGELDVNIAHFARTLTDSLQQFQQLFLITVAIGKNLFEQSL